MSVLVLRCTILRKSPILFVETKRRKKSYKYRCVIVTTCHLISCPWHLHPSSASGSFVWPLLLAVVALLPIWRGQILLVLSSPVRAAADSLLVSFVSRPLLVPEMTMPSSEISSSMASTVRLTLLDSGSAGWLEPEADVEAATSVSTFRLATLTTAFLCTRFGFSISMRPCAPLFFCSSSDSLSEASLFSALPDSSSPLSSEPDSSGFFFFRHFLDSSDFRSSSSCSEGVKWRFRPLWLTNFPEIGDFVLANSRHEGYSTAFPRNPIRRDSNSPRGILVS